jgi:hypothetical protein
MPYSAAQSGTIDIHVAKLSIEEQALKRFDSDRRSGEPEASVADDFHQHTFFAPAIKLSIKNLFPRAKIQPAVRDGDNDFPSHHLPLNVSISIVFPCVIVAIYVVMRGDPLQETVIILQQSLFIVIDVHAGRDVHGVHQYKTLLNAALLDDLFHLRRDIDVGAAGLRFEPEFFAVGTHDDITVAALCDRQPERFKPDILSETSSNEDAAAIMVHAFSPHRPVVGAAFHACAAAVA